MYKPLADCHRCTKLPKRLEEIIAYRKAQLDKPHMVDNTGELYIIPCIVPREKELDAGQWRRTWPRYHGNEFKDGGSPGPQCDGESMLELDEEGRRALQIVVLRIELQKEEYGSIHKFNWKKTGLSRAYFKPQLVTEATMHTPRGRAAFRYLTMA